MLDEDDDPFDRDDRPDPAAGYREPDPEPDPEADLPDPESELPSVPSVEVPEPPDPDEVPDGLLRGFWTTVLLFNAALLVVTFGLLMVVFGVERPIGVGLLVLGALLGRRGYRRYRVLDERHRSGELTVDGDGQDDPDRTSDGDVDGPTTDNGNESTSTDSGDQSDRCTTTGDRRNG